MRTFVISLITLAVGITVGYHASDRECEEEMMRARNRMLVELNKTSDQLAECKKLQVKTMFLALSLSEDRTINKLVYRKIQDDYEKPNSR